MYSLFKIATCASCTTLCALNGWRHTVPFRANKILPYPWLVHCWETCSFWPLKWFSWGSCDHKKVFWRMEKASWMVNTLHRVVWIIYCTWTSVHHYWLGYLGQPHWSRLWYRRRLRVAIVECFAGLLDYYTQGAIWCRTSWLGITFGRRLGGLASSNTNALITNPERRVTEHSRINYRSVPHLFLILLSLWGI